MCVCVYRNSDRGVFVRKDQLNIKSLNEPTWEAILAEHGPRNLINIPFLNILMYMHIQYRLYFREILASPLVVYV